MKKEWKIVAIALSVLCLSFVVVIFWAKTLLKPEELKKIAIQEISKKFPTTHLNIGNIDVGYGYNFSIMVNEFDWSLNDGRKLFNVHDINIRVPIWSIIFNSGTVEIKIESPTINYLEKPNALTSNWSDVKSSLVDDSAANKKSDSSSDSKNKAEGSIPSFLKKVKLNFKMIDSNLVYQLKDNSEGKLLISKFIVKGISLNSPTAFEISTHFNSVRSDKSELGFDTLIIGELNISDLLKNGEVKTLIRTKINNITKTGLNSKFPEIVSNLDVRLTQKGNMSGNGEITTDGASKISFDFNIDKIIELKNLSVDIGLKEWLGIVNIPEKVDFSRSRFSLHGNAMIDENHSKTAKFQFSLSPGFIFKEEPVVADTTLSGSYNGTELLCKIKTELLDGVISSNINAKYNLNAVGKDIKSLPQIDIKVLASGLKLTEKAIHAFLWKKNSPSAPENTPSQVSTTMESKDETGEIKGKELVNFPPTNLNIEWNNISVGVEDFSGKGHVALLQNRIGIDNLQFKFSKGSGKLSQTISLQKDFKESKFSFSMANLNLESFKAFLPPFIENFSGEVTGTVEGNAKIFNNAKLLPVYSTFISLEANKGEMKKLNLSSFLDAIWSKFPQLKPKDDIKLTGNFDALSLKGQFSNELYKIEKVNFMGPNKKISLNGNGVLYPAAVSTKESVMEMVLNDNVQKPWPLRLTGPGFNLKPDIGYTATKLAKNAVKSKVDEVVQKNLDKVIPAQAKEKVQGLIKGLFK